MQEFKLTFEITTFIASKFISNNMNVNTSSNLQITNYLIVFDSFFQRNNKKTLNFALLTCHSNDHKMINQLLAA